MSLREKNVGIVKRFVEELWNGQRPELAETLLAENAVTHQLTSNVGPIPTASRTRADLKNEVVQWFKAFPDLRWSIEQVVADGDLVVARYVVRGTHKGTWYGIPATNKLAEFRMIHTVRIENEQIAEDWLLADWHSLLHQLGLVPSIATLIAEASTPAGDSQA